jgi:hypothetical protein
VTFGAKVNGLDAAVSFYEYGEDGRLLHKTPLDIKVGTSYAYYCLELKDGCFIAPQML